MTRRRGGSRRRAEAASGWLFITPTVLVLGLFLAVPVVMAAWVSVSDWHGVGNPFTSGARFVGADNYAKLVWGGGLAEQNFGTSLRNNLYYVVFVVPLQTAVSLGLALLVNRKVGADRGHGHGHGHGFFRTAFYFPSVTSSVAITVLWLFLFSSSGAVNDVLAAVGIHGPNWFNEPSGLLHDALGVVGVHRGPHALTAHTALGISWWEWLAGPSVAMCAYIVLAIFTTSGTFMLLFLAALQNASADIDEAAMLDGTNAWERFWLITLPQLRPTLFTVLTLGLIGTWQVFDQIYTGTKGAPANTTMTPAYLSYTSAFQSQQWGVGAAIAFVLFAIIVVFTLVQRWALRERGPSRRRTRWIRQLQAAAPVAGPR